MATNPHIYVSSVVGTNTGGSDTSYASQQTGAMTSLTAGNVYDNIGSAMAGASPSSGDTIYVADNHSASYDNGTNIIIASGVKLISVDNTAIDGYKPGASEHLTDTADDYFFGHNCGIFGISLETGDNTVTVSGSEPHIHLQDCTITGDSSGDLCISVNSDGSSCRLINVNCAANSSAVRALNIASGGTVHWDGGQVSTVGVLMNIGTNGGGSAYINGVDLSSCTSIFAGKAKTDDYIFVKITNCKLHSSVTLPSSYGKMYQRFEMYNCDNGTDDKLYRFYISDYAGVAKNNDSTYVTATETWYEGSDKSSIEVTTTSVCSERYPFIFELPAQYVDLSQAASDVITIDLVTDSTAVSLTDTDIAAFLVYPDGTTSVQANWVTSGKTVGTGNYGIDPLAAGTALSASSLGAGDWTGEPASANFYKMELDTSGDAGQATAVSIRIEVYKASIASGDLFIHPLLTLS